MSNGKRFIAYEIIKRLEEKRQSEMLLQLKEGLTERDIKKRQKHKVFEDSFDAKPIYHRQFFVTKNKLHTPELRSGKMETGGTLGRLRV